jgi:hypothetical protein
MSAPKTENLFDLPYLTEIWQRYTHRDDKHEAGDWRTVKTVLDGLGLPLEETIQYLRRQQPRLGEFERWILERNDGEIESLRLERLRATIDGTPYSDDVTAMLRAIEESEPVLSAEDLSFWEENGYVVLHDAISPEACRAAELAVWQHLQMDAADERTWYQPSTHGIMRQFFHHPALRRNRRSSRIHKAFAQIWGTADLWATVDRVSFNPPERLNWTFPGPFLHWDTSLSLPIAFGVGGLIYLTDTEAEQGAFNTVPGFHRRIAAWLNGLPSDADPRDENLEALGAVPIPGRAGDLIIWREALPHGSRPNRCTRPRIVQYLNMHPATPEHNLTWK